MKKHAKKSLWLPIFVLVSVIAIAASCYLAQTFNAFAEDEVDADAVEAPQPNDTVRVMSRIHFSDPDEVLYGSIEKYEEGTTPFWPTTVLAHEFVFDTSGDYYISWDQSVEEEIVIYGDPPFTDVLHIQIPFYRVCTDVLFNWLDDNNVDITIMLADTYTICFDANGGYIYDSSETTVEYIKQAIGYRIHMPNYVYRGEDYKFVGWFTERWGGYQVFPGSEVPEWGTYFVLYAHWAPVDDWDDPIDFHFMTDSFYKQFEYTFWYVDYINESYDPSDYDEISSGKTSNLTLSDLYEEDGWTFPDDVKLNNGSYYKDFRYGAASIRDVLPAYAAQKMHLGYRSSVLLTWTDDWSEPTNSPGDYHETTFYLIISPIDGQHIDWTTLNGSVLTDLGGTSSLLDRNNVVISTAWNVPGYIGIASDDGSLFRCQYVSYDYYSEPQRYNFVSDYVPIFVGPDENVMYAFGSTSDGPFRAYSDAFSLEVTQEFGDTSGVPLTIRVIDNGGSEGLNSVREYRFSDVKFTLFDWFDINSYIKGVSLDGESLRAANYPHILDNGYHNFVFKMSDNESEVTVTYDANGGHFADDSTTMTLDARYGEALPLVENPVAIDNDFVGWFTEPEGGVQVNPADYHWMPWDRWAGVTLYAHWAYNPQPVPPEPVPPEPGPTPEPVNPDVPGGGGTAQTGDDMGMAFALFAIIAMVGACGLVTRKLYIK